MQPAYSVIVFTVASGAGFGLLAWLAFSILTVPLASSPLFYLASFGLGFLLAIGGLLSSTLHLGHPERAWRAFSQWRTSWLSREGVAAVACLGFAAMLAIAALLDLHPVILRILAVPVLLLAIATVWCTGMIYESLPTVRAWSHWLTTEIYLMLAVTSGALLKTTLLALFGAFSDGTTWTVVLLLAVAAVMKLVYWRGIDRTPRILTAGTATGLGSIGHVRSLESPHTQANFIMREMGYQVARKHADSLRMMTMVLTFGLPAALLALAELVLPSLKPLAAVLATLAMAAGLLVERWLFFAEAQHVVTLYYGEARA